MWRSNIVNHLFCFGFQKIDFAIVPVSFSNETNDAMVASKTVMTLTFMVVRKRPVAGTDYFLILRPLSLPVWLSSCAMGIVFSLILMIYGCIDPTVMKNLAEDESDLRKKNVCQISTMAIAAAFTFTKLSITPTTISNRVFAIILWIFTYLILILYAAAMMNILLNIRPPNSSELTPDRVLANAQMNKFAFCPSFFFHYKRTIPIMPN